MKISTTTDRLARLYGMDEAIRMIGKFGFDCVDFSNFSIRNWEQNPVFTPGWEAYADHLRAVAEEAGITFNQSHAPFPSCKPEKEENREYNDIIVEKLHQAIRFAGRLGAKAVVVHPLKEFPHYGREQYWKDRNMEFYRALAPTAKEAGIKIALENMFVTDPNRKFYTESVCGDPREFADYLDTLADDCFTACLDLGHCAICGYSAADCIRILGADRLGALHVHDNDCKTDNHLPPFTGQQDWTAVTDALREIGYRGELTLESDRIFVNTPAEMFPSTLRYLHDVARCLADKCEG